jgi:asparagine synthase (glutamine-hydrolysing)
MCGIVGLAGVEDASLVRRMAEAVAHRGPDGEGFFVGDGVSLGMRRLGIIDPTGSEQPIGNEDGSVLTIFNGEVYNYRRLRPFLERHGHSFRTAGDTETVVHLYEEYGEAGVHLLRGMFAYAVWDRRRRRLLLIRDRLGIKPLYYAQAGRALAFASEIKALLAVPDVARGLDPDALAQYLTLQYVPGPATILRSIRKLPPGHWLAWQDGRVEVHAYWDLVFDGGDRRLDEATAAAELRERLDDSIAHHRISDVPLGVLLSGGIDSAAVTALLARAGGRVRTFTVGFDVDGSEGELAEARRVARHFGTDHHELVMGPALADTLPDIVRMQDEPVGDPAAIPTFLVCRFAARSVKVVLTGEGGDEVFGGYPRYGWLRLGERLRERPRLTAAAARLLRAMPRAAREARTGRRVVALVGAAPLEDRHLTWVATMSDDVQHALTGTAGWGAARAIVRGLVGRDADADTVHDLMYLDVKTWLPDDVLVKTDRMSMAASIEARVPWLDHRVVEFAAGLPASLKVRSLGTKALLRHALRGDLPAATVRRPKRAFLVPLRQWLVGELRELLHDTLRSGSARARGLFRPEAIGRLLEEQGTGRHDHSRALWTLLCLELWLRSVLDAPAPAHD